MAGRTGAGHADVTIVGASASVGVSPASADRGGSAGLAGFEETGPALLPRGSHTILHLPCLERAYIYRSVPSLVHSAYSRRAYLSSDPSPLHGGWRSAAQLPAA